MRITALITGCIAAFLAVFAQGFLSLNPPPAYGICVICHGRDLINWLSNFLFSTNFPITQVSKNFPLLTVIGVVIGAFVAAYTNKELNFKWIENKFTSFITGMLVMISGLVVLACPMRLLLRTAYGDFIALAGVIALVIGVILGTFALKWRAEKS
ncbi:putative membrane protein YeaQ/YmgE (transglycosylase-associated protein family) [Desulfitispora alkaliphila]|uniref:cytochrome C n=1 Tax=Desulfitispora alkaliphila TaxID=622674 RepID=UPI003D22389C